VRSHVAAYMTENPRERIVAWEWWADGIFGTLYPDDTGDVYFKNREAPEDIWSPPMRLGGSVTLSHFLALVKREGFHYLVKVEKLS
jgi:hypothetical protein